MEYVLCLYLAMKTSSTFSSLKTYLAILFTVIGFIFRYSIISYGFNSPWGK